VGKVGETESSAAKLCRAVLVAEKLGVLSPEALVAALRLSPEEARMVVAALVAAGWVEPVEESECPCSRCPFARFCPFARGAQRPRRLYRVRRDVVEKCRRYASR
jgi:hypothetical protein